MKSWKGFRPFLLVAPEPDTIAGSTGLTFSESFDDLSKVRESAFSGSEGTVFGLVRHEGAPVPGTEVLAHAEDLASGVESLRREALEALHLDESEVRWTLQDEEVQARERVFVAFDLAEERAGWSEEVVQALETGGFEPVVPPRGTLEDLEGYRRLMASTSSVLLLGSFAEGLTHFDLGMAKALRKLTVMVDTADPGTSAGAKVRADKYVALVESAGIQGAMQSVLSYLSESLGALGSVGTGGEPSSGQHGS